MKKYIFTLFLIFPLFSLAQDELDAVLSNQEVKKEEKVEEKSPEPKKTAPAPKHKDFIINSVQLTKEEQEILAKRRKARSLDERPDLKQEVEENKKKATAIYSPAPVRDGKDDHLLLERDSSIISTASMSVKDSMTIKTCFDSGVQIIFTEDIKTTIQDAVVDDKVHFDAVVFENKKAAYARLKIPMKDSEWQETALRLVRQDNDKTYLINFIALPCPNGLYPYPKVVYLTEKNLMAVANDSKMMTAEDKIITLSQGLPRLQKNKIRVYDMVLNSGVDWAILGVEVQFPNRKTKDFDADLSKYFKVLDTFQTTELKIKVDYLEVPSLRSTKERGTPTMRFNIKIPIGKKYILDDRYIHLMYVDKEENHYQYIRIDTMPYFLSLKKRGYNL